MEMELELSPAMDLAVKQELFIDRKLNLNDDNITSIKLWCAVRFCLNTQLLEESLNFIKFLEHSRTEIDEPFVEYNVGKVTVNGTHVPRKKQRLQ